MSDERELKDAEVKDGELKDADLKDVNGASGPYSPHNVYFICRGCNQQFGFRVPGMPYAYPNEMFIYTHSCGLKNRIRPQGNIWINEPVY